MDEIAARLARARRPVLLPGAGVRIAGAVESLHRLLDVAGIPVATAFNAHDLIADHHPLAVGRPGTIGNRGGNFAVQDADFVLVLGCRLNIRQISYNWQSFARNGTVVMVDIDRHELAKPTLNVDLPVHADLAEFLPRLAARVDPSLATRIAPWASLCKARHHRYPVVLPEYWKKEPVNPYCFMDVLSDHLPADAVVVTGDATACITAFQALRLKQGQRLYSNSGSASMGYDLPAAIGAAKTGLAREIVCLAGDGSIMMNLQELQTIVGQDLPIKIFLLNNRGYHSIRQTQMAYFPDSLVGFSPATGVTFPDWQRLSGGFGIPYRRAERPVELEAAVADTLKASGPQLCEILVDPEQPFSPRIASRRLEDGTMVSSPLEDMFPFLPRDELAENMTGEQDP